MGDSIKALERNTRQRAELLAERDRLILAAKAENVQVTQIAAARADYPYGLHFLG